MTELFYVVCSAANVDFGNRILITLNSIRLLSLPVSYFASVIGLLSDVQDLSSCWISCTALLLCGDLWSCPCFCVVFQIALKWFSCHTCCTYCHTQALSADACVAIFTALCHSFLISSVFSLPSITMILKFSPCWVRFFFLSDIVQHFWAPSVYTPWAHINTHSLFTSIVFFKAVNSLQFLLLCKWIFLILFYMI